MTAARKERNTFLGNYSPSNRDEKYHSKLYMLSCQSKGHVQSGMSLFQLALLYIVLLIFRKTVTLSSHLRRTNSDLTSESLNQKLCHIHLNDCSRRKRGNMVLLRLLVAKKIARAVTCRKDIPMLRKANFACVVPSHRLMTHILQYRSVRADAWC